MARSTHSKATLPWPALALLFVIPLVLGLAFHSDGSGNGDGAAYRSSICYIETQGVIPLARLEWSHPGHLLTAWGLTSLLSWLGLAQDPHHGIHLLNFLALGLLALAVARTWQIFDPDRGRSFLAGLCVAIIPGWLWCAQEPLSDVSGHSLVALCVCSLLALQSRLPEGRALISGAFLSAFLAGLAFLFRPSAGLFIPLFLWLGHEVLWRAKGQRIRLTAAFLAGALLPIVAIYAHLILAHGKAEFLSAHFPEVVHNMEFRGLKATLGLAKDWFHSSHRGLGTYAFLLAVTGWLAWLLAGDWRIALNDETQQQRPQKRSILRPFFLFTLGLLPYFVFLLGNPAAGQFRFSLPVQLALILGLVPLLGHLQRLRPGGWSVGYTGIFAVATILHALPLLILFSTRQHFVEQSALEITRVAQETDLLLGHESAPYLRLRQDYGSLLSDDPGRPAAQSRPATTTGVRFDSSEYSWDFWNRGWRQVEQEILNKLDRSERVLYTNELSMSSFRHWLALRGFGERTLLVVPARTLRHRMDASLETMDRNHARRLVDLHVMQVEAPDVRIDAGLEGSLHARAPASPFAEYRLLAGKYTEDPGIEVATMQLPLAPDAAVTTLAAGRLDANGDAHLDVDPRSRPAGEAWILVLLGPDGMQTLARSRPFFAHAEDDRTPPGTHVRNPSHDEMRLR